MSKEVCILDTVIRDRRRLRKRRRYFRLFRFICAAALIVTIIVIGAFHLPGAGENVKPDTTDIKKVSLISVQDKLETLSWVEQKLLPVNDYSRPGAALKNVNAIVIHYVGNPGTTAAQNRSFYSRLAENHETKASSNFLVGMDGEILACVPLDEVAFCSNWRNDDTVSIECCHPDETGKFTDATYNALIRLTAWLCNELGLDALDLIRHYDITQKECPKYFVDHEDAWEAFKEAVQNALDKLQAPSPDKTAPAV